MPIPQELFFLVGWAEEPVPSIDKKDFCKRSILVETGFFTLSVGGNEVFCSVMTEKLV